MSTEIMSALIALVGVLASAWIAHRTAKYTAKKEMEAMLLSWDREDSVSADSAFAEMIQAVRSFTSCENDYFRYEAMNKVDIVRLKESESVNTVLVQLRSALEQCDRYRSTQLLDKAIEVKNQKKEKMTAKHRF